MPCAQERQDDLRGEMQIRLAEQHARFEAALAAAEAKALARGASSAPTSTTAYGPSSGGEDSQSSQPPAGKRKSLKARAAAGLTRARARYIQVHDPVAHYRATYAPSLPSSSDTN